jgi:RimJ/RimL family protein N-acetyltransferase
MSSRFRIEWAKEEDRLTAVEPTADLVRAHATELAGAYNDTHNAAMMGHSDEMSAEDVVRYYASMAAEGARMFLLFRDGVLIGDADLRGIDGRHAEFAIMVGARAVQGKGLGTRFATMIHALAFGALGLERLYVTIVPENAASRRVFEKLGYAVDDSDVARGFVDDDDDVSMSIGAAEFHAAHREALSAIRVTDA